ncbi:D-alanyl-D-alanine carboxypeptidase family protein [Microbulbifer sp. ARAS458-1]|uniref:D-alanyl-D-alanine carboxypeptidase family protein n=1 Tax=Microbulbifer sp. ARAS458-1 TaxID=3140242 RepID=UPI003877AC0C
MEDTPPSNHDSLTAKSAIGVITSENNTGTTLCFYEKEADRPISPASITKLLTALTAVKTIINSNIPIDSHLKVLESDDAEGSGRNLKAGDQITFLDCIANLLISSSNISANVIARELGDVLLATDPRSARNPTDRFILEMNRIARQLKMENSRFSNSHGLAHKAQYSTARDLSRLVSQCSEILIIRGLWNKLRYKITVHGKNERQIDIQSSFIFSTLGEVPTLDIPLFRGGKSGALWPSHFNLAATSSLGSNLALISVTLGSASPRDRYNDYLSMVRLAKRFTAKTGQ